MEIISINRRNGKKQELLKRIEEMLHKNEIVFAFNSKQLQERDRQIRKQVCDEIREIFNFGEYDKQLTNPEIRIKYNTFVNVLNQIEKGE